jgi:hypothetical protein
MDHLQVLRQQQKVAFNKNESHIRCIAHVINLAVQASLKELKSENAEEDDSELAQSDTDVADLIPKVRICHADIGLGTKANSCMDLTAAPKTGC